MSIRLQQHTMYRTVRGGSKIVKIHIVQKGDTLWKLAKKYGVNFEQLKSVNTQLSNPDMIMPGMKIKIPTGSVPVKKEGPVAGKIPIKEQAIYKKEGLTPPPTTTVQQAKAPQMPKMPQPMKQPMAQQKPAYNVNQHMYDTNMNVHLYQPQAKPMPVQQPPIQKKAELKKEMPKPMKKEMQMKPQQMPKPPTPPVQQQPQIPMQQPVYQPQQPMYQQPSYYPFDLSCLQPISPIMPGCAPSHPPLYAPMHQSQPMYQPQMMPMQQPPMGAPTPNQMAPQNMPYFPQQPQMQPMQPQQGYGNDCNQCGPPQPMMYGPNGQMMSIHDYEQMNGYRESDDYED